MDDLPVLIPFDGRINAKPKEFDRIMRDTNFIYKKSVKKIQGLM
jgi:hypothetical protein